MGNAETVLVDQGGIAAFPVFVLSMISVKYLSSNDIITTPVISFPVEEYIGEAELQTILPVAFEIVTDPAFGVPFKALKNIPF